MVYWAGHHSGSLCSLVEVAFSNSDLSSHKQNIPETVIRKFLWCMDIARSGPLKPKLYQSNNRPHPSLASSKVKRAYLYHQWRRLALQIEPINNRTTQDLGVDATCYKLGNVDTVCVDILKREDHFVTHGQSCQIVVCAFRLPETLIEMNVIFKMLHYPKHKVARSRAPIPATLSWRFGPAPRFIGRRIYCRPTMLGLNGGFIQASQIRRLLACRE